jgi:hypothetical protein
VARLRRLKGTVMVITEMPMEQSRDACTRHIGRPTGIEYPISSDTNDRIGKRRGRLQVKMNEIVCGRFLLIGNERKVKGRKKKKRIYK